MDWGATRFHARSSKCIKNDIAVDPLECTNHVAKDLPNAMAVLAWLLEVLLHAPDCYMNKIAGSSDLVGQINRMRKPRITSNQPAWL